MYNEELIRMIKKCINKNEYQFCANQKDLQELTDMVNRGYLLKFDKVHELNCNNDDETHVVIYPTNKINELF